MRPCPDDDARIVIAERAEPAVGQTVDSRLASPLPAAPLPAAHLPPRTPMRKLGGWLAFLFVGSALSAFPAAALESQALALAEPLPAEIRQVFGCGQWAESGSSGYYRVVLIDVGHGAGTEVYIQRVQEAVSESQLSLRLMETTPLRELNNDHAQYQVSSAKCTGAGARAAVELIATFEHDDDQVEHRIRIRLASPGSYPVSDVVFRPRRK